MDPISAISAGSGLLGSILGSVAMGKQIRRAQTAQDQASANALAMGRNVFNYSAGQLAPYANAGLGATGMMNALLGIPAAQPAAAGGAMAVEPGYTDEEALAFLRSTADGPTGKRIRKAGSLSEALGYADAGERARYDAWTQSRTPLAPMGGATAAAPVVDQPTADDAFDRFINSTGYQFRVNEGRNDIEQQYAARGALQSGAAMKDLERFRQGVASEEFGRFLGYLDNQQRIGLTAAQGQVGAAQNYGNAGQVNIINQGDNTGNALLARGINQQRAIGQVGQGLNELLGSSFGARSAGGAAAPIVSSNVPWPALRF